jgi:poly(3-hydroxybutyrate) depolymerase
MGKSVLVGSAFIFFALHSVAFGQSSAPNSTPQGFQTGAIIAKVTCLKASDQSYALYLPSQYTREKKWPIVYAFDPDALGSRPVEAMKAAAERYGHIVVGSNNGHNGLWKAEAEIAQVMFVDTQARLSIDTKRLYFSGFSGGARFASSVAQICKCAAGLLLDGAGFEAGSPPVAGGNFAVFATAGNIDFNYIELVNLDAKFDTLHYEHAFRTFEGPHQWAPASVMDEAFAWFRLMAMKDGRETPDPGFVSEQAAAAESRAKALEAAGDPYGAWKEYRQAAETFDGLAGAAAEDAAFRERATALEKEKAVRDGAKQEQDDFREQTERFAPISSGLSTLRLNTENPGDLRDQLTPQILQIYASAQHEKNPEKLRVLQRTLGSVFVQAMEAGDDLYEAKDYWRARYFYELGAVAEPDSSWTWRSVAESRAMTGDRKGACEAIRRARDKAKDPAAFYAWLNDDPAFAKLRDTAEFRAVAAKATETK